MSGFRSFDNVRFSETELNINNKRVLWENINGHTYRPNNISTFMKLKKDENERLTTPFEFEISMADGSTQKCRLNYHQAQVADKILKTVVLIKKNWARKDQETAANLQMYCRTCDTSKPSWPHEICKICGEKLSKR